MRQCSRLYQRSLLRTVRSLREEVHLSMALKESEKSSRVRGNVHPAATVLWLRTASRRSRWKRDGSASSVAVLDFRLFSLKCPVFFFFDSPWFCWFLFFTLPHKISEKKWTRGKNQKTASPPKTSVNSRSIGTGSVDHCGFALAR